MISELLPKMKESTIIVILSSVVLILCNFWLVSCIFIILAIGQFLTFSFVFKNKLVESLQYYTHIEYETRKKMMAFLVNNLRGRDVIQSFERVSEFCRE